MSGADHPTRRTLLMTSLLVAAGTTAPASGAGIGDRGKTLVANVSRNGNTRVIAGQIHRSLGADLFEIEPAKPYPEDYFETVEEVRQERHNGFEPPLKTLALDIASFTTVFLGFPIWGETAPTVIRSFLSQHDLSNKTIVPFITLGGYGLGNSLSVIRAHAQQARIAEGFSMQCPQKRQTIIRVNDWLGSMK